MQEQNKATNTYMPRFESSKIMFDPYNFDNDYMAKYKVKMRKEQARNNRRIQKKILKDKARREAARCL